MDDFLHNLRSGKLKQPDRGRRDYSDYKGPQRRVQNDRRRQDYYTKVTSENFALVKDSLEVLANGQKRIEGKLAELNATGIRIAAALEALADTAKRVPQEAAIAPPQEAAIAPVPEPTPVVPSEGDTGNIALAKGKKIVPGKVKLEERDKPKMLRIITKMRDAGTSWEKIARHMDEVGYPTISGKGKWRGPSIKKFWDTHS